MTMASLSRGKYLSLIDAGVSNLWSLSFPGHLESLNLHGNLIQHISNLGHLRHLVHLDLSANHISVIDNLDNLTSLKTLNLSCNLITVIEGLSPLRSLERLDVSYNKIDDIRGVSDVTKLIHLNVHGNKLNSIKDVIQALAPCNRLTHLTLELDDSSNPLCQGQDYESKIFRGLSQLTCLNNTNISGNPITDDALTNIPGLESYLDFLLSSNDAEKSTQESMSKSSTAAVALLTPKIDAVMNQFKQRYGEAAESSSPSPGPAEMSTSSSDFTQYTESMRKILSPSTKAVREPKTPRRQKDTKFLTNSGEENDQPVRDSPAVSGRHRQGKMTSSTGNREKDTGSAKRGKSTERKKKPLTQSHTVDYGARPRQQTHQLRGRTVNMAALASSDDMTKDDHTGNMPRFDQDRQKREELGTGYKDLLSTLQAERERRWKAEQAARKMADILKDVHAKHKTSDEMKTSALEATVQLKQAVLNEHESNQRLNQEISRLQVDLDTTREKLAEAGRDVVRGREALKVAQSTMAQMEGDGVVEKAHQSKKLQEAHQKASAMAREAELLRHSLEATKVKVEQLQETLASREQQHREEMRSRYSLNSPELKEVIESKVKEVERQRQGELVRQQERVETLSRQYSDLENEFRQALTMEEARFRELRTELDTTSTENMENKHLLLAAQRKDETSTNIIAELSALVKEQKGRITELAKSKQEQHLNHKDYIQKLEDNLEEARRQAAHLEQVRQAKSKLQATAQAQESVIEGLKAERKLWGLELAQQGASLAQDRGRLESRIETYNSEIAMLKKQLEREADSVKIKTKMVEDQTETIRKLKEAVVERDNTIRETREESLATHKDLEEQLSELKSALDDSRDLLDRSSARKEELKQKVSDLEAELQDSKSNHSSLSARWKEKSELIGRLEQQVTQMRNNWSQKEAKLAAERDMAFQQSKQAVEKLKLADVAFRQQLDVKEAACQEKLRQMEEDKQQEIELANRKVEMVEEEMRDLLRENESSKRVMEAKMKKLTQALGDLQSDLL